MKHYDYLIVGAGLFGCTFAHQATLHGKSCLVIDVRSHTGGNIYCENVKGINVHKYGAHIFHTANKRVWKYVNDLVEFNRYTNSPVANYKGELYNLPFNMNTFYQLWQVKTPVEAQAISLVGRDIYEKLIKEYTEKQWGRRCTELPAFIIRRLPVRFTFDNNYFRDPYQGIPIGGYNVLINRLLEGVDVRLSADFMVNRKEWMALADKTVYTGAVDAYYSYCYGKLSYRTVRFETELLEGVENYQGNAVVNYTDAATPYTRIIEHKHFEFGTQSDTVISKEFSSEWTEGSEPYYPVNDGHNEALYKKYKELADKEPNVIFGGRLAEYKYYDMDKVIESALERYEQE